MKTSKHQMTHIHFTDDEYATLKDDAMLYRKSIPDVIKAVYFRQALARPLLASDDARKILAELNRIGNNVNQIARQMNSGIRDGFNPAVDELRQEVAALRHMVMGAHGNH